MATAGQNQDKGKKGLANRLWRARERKAIASSELAENIIKSGGSRGEKNESWLEGIALNYKGHAIHLQRRVVRVRKDHKRRESSGEALW